MQSTKSAFIIVAILISTAGCGALDQLMGKKSEKQKEAEQVAAENNSFDQERADLSQKIAGLQAELDKLKLDSAQSAAEKDARMAELEKQLAETNEKLRLVPKTGRLNQTFSSDAERFIDTFNTYYDNGRIDYQIHPDGRFVYAGKIDIVGLGNVQYFSKTYQLKPVHVKSASYQTPGANFFHDKAEFSVKSVEPELKVANIFIEQKVDDGEHFFEKVSDTRADMKIETADELIDIISVDATFHLYRSEYHFIFEK